MKFAELSPVLIEKIKAMRYDHILEKHEGPWDWKYLVESGELEFIAVCGYHILLPVYEETRQNITAVRCIVSQDTKVLTLFLKDMTYIPSPREEMFYCGRLAICEQMPGERFYIATVYHEWFIVENEELKQE